MRFRWEPNSYGRCGLVAMPERGDVHPIFDELWLDHVIDTVDPDRLAAAAALTFHRGGGSGFKVPEAVSPGTARAIEALAPKGSRRVDLVRPTDLPRARGRALLVLSVDDPTASVENALGRHRRVALNVLRTDRYSGGLLTMDTLSLASNAWLHSSRAGSGLESHLPYLAVAVLVAEDLGAGAIELASETLCSDESLASKLVGLCNAVGLALFRGGEDAGV